LFGLTFCAIRCIFKEICVKARCFMKRAVLFFLTLALLLSMTACGGKQSTGNPDHDYVIALMEEGDYAMAITVLEHLMEENGDTPHPKEDTDIPANEDPGPASEEPTPAEPVVPADDTGLRQLAINTVQQFMADKGDAMVKGFKEHSGSPGREPVVINAMEYRLDNCDGNGNNAHCLLIAIEADIYDGSGFADRLQLLLDMDTQTVYNSAEIDWELLSRGEYQNEEEFNTFLLNGYTSYLLYGGEPLWSEMEFRQELTEDDIAAINEALW